MNQLNAKTLKTFCLSLMLLAGTFLLASGVHAQDAQVKLDQVGLMKQLAGVWQKEEAAGTVPGFDIRQYGESFVQANYSIAGGAKQLGPLYSYTFFPKEGRFRVIGHTPDGNIQTWTASFSAPNTFILYRVQNFSSKRVMRKHVVVLTGPSNFEINVFGPDGAKKETTKWSRVP